MNFKDILKEIEQATPGAFEEVNGRRQVLKSFGSKVAVAALPFALGTLFQKASAQTTTTDPILQVLNFGLEMEFFAYNYYHTANNTGSLIPAADQAGFITIADQKKAHILLLQKLITDMGGVPYTPGGYDPTATNPLYIVSGAYDFTSKGKYQVFSHYPTFIMLAEVFEDAFVRGYNGETTTLLANMGMLEIVMRLKATTARYASHVRFVRRQLGYTVAPEHPTPWITNNIPPHPDFLANYNGEENAIQQTIDISALPGLTGTTPLTAATAAFDETMEREPVRVFMSKFWA